MKTFFAAALSLALLAPPAWAAHAPVDSPLFFEATVVEDGGPCNYFVFEIKRADEPEYVIVEWMGMDVLEEGDKVVGRFEGGPEEVRNVTRDTKLNVWVHEFYFSYGMAFEAFTKACREMFGPALPDPHGLPVLE